MIQAVLTDDFARGMILAYGCLYDLRLMTEVHIYMNKQVKIPAYNNVFILQQIKGT